MTYWPLAQFLCTPEYLEDLEKADQAWAEYIEWGDREDLKTELKPSRLITLFSQIDTTAMREKTELLADGATETTGPYVNLSAERGYGTLLEQDWEGTDADAFAAYVENPDGLDRYFADIRSQTATAIDRFTDIADAFDAACEDLYAFCQEHIVGFADKYGYWAALGTAARDASIAAGIGFAAGAIGGAPFGGVGAVLGAAIGAIVTFLLTLVVRIVQLDAEMQARAAELMQSLNPRQYTSIDDRFTPYGTEAVPR